MPQLAQMGVCNPGNPLQLVKITPNRRETRVRRAVFTAAHAHRRATYPCTARGSHAAATSRHIRIRPVGQRPRHSTRGIPVVPPHTRATRAPPNPESRAEPHHGAHTRRLRPRTYTPGSDTGLQSESTNSASRTYTPGPGERHGATHRSRGAPHTYEKTVHPGPTQDARPSRTLIRRPADDGTTPPAAGHGDRRQPRRASTQSTMYGATCSI